MTHQHAPVLLDIAGTTLTADDLGAGEGDAANAAAAPGTSASGMRRAGAGKEGARIVMGGGETAEQLPGGEHHLVGRLAAPAAPAHAIGDHRQQAARRARMLQQRKLVLLVFPVSLVDAGGGGESKAC